jgi:hypothetical protein
MAAKIPGMNRISSWRSVVECQSEGCKLIAMLDLGPKSDVWMIIDLERMELDRINQPQNRKF